MNKTNFKKVVILSCLLLFLVWLDCCISTAIAQQVNTSNINVSSELADGQSVIILQYGLYLLGFDPGPTDGKLGNKTKMAIRAFQKANNLPVDGELKEYLLEHISKSIKKSKPEIRLKRPRYIKGFTTFRKDGIGLMVAVTPLAMNKYQEAINALITRERRVPTLLIYRMMEAEKLIGLPSDIKVQILELFYEHAKAKIVEGDQSGRLIYVPWEYIKPDERF